MVHDRCLSVTQINNLKLNFSKNERAASYVLLYKMSDKMVCSEVVEKGVECEEVGYVCGDIDLSTDAPCTDENDYFSNVDIAGEIASGKVEFANQINRKSE